jgi:uncharacterized protein YgiM (DUF1202 family)
MADIDRIGNKNFTFAMMKTNFWLILGTMIAASAIAQDTNALPPIPAPVTSPAAEVAPASVAVDTNAPAATPVKHKKHAPLKKLAEPTVTLAPGQAEVAVTNLNVRGQAGLKGEFLTHLTFGDVVTVLSQINLDKHLADEPAQWAKIAFPTNAHVWVSAQFIDATNQTVLPKKLNLRAGPSENYSVLGVIERGTVVSEVITKDGWMQIDPPTNAYAFVAAMYLKQESSGNMATNTAPSAETETPMTTNSVPEPEPIVTEPTNPPPAVVTNAPEPMAVDTNTPAAAETNLPAPVAVDTNLPPPPPRVVTHEGTVRHVVSIIAPTDYELYDPATGENVDYLFTTSKDLDLSRYNGLRVVVTGTEGLDTRWKETPVITVQRIQVAR